MDRRKFLRFGAIGAVASAGFVNNALAEVAAPVVFDRSSIPQLPKEFWNNSAIDALIPEVRKASLYNLHTGESIDVVYKENENIIPDALAEVNKVLRDYRNDQVCEMDVKLLDLLDTLARKLETNDAFNVISGYRSPSTNNMLAERSNGVAKNSMHMQGKAIDIRVPGVSLTHLRNVAKEIQVGGVGYYASSNFVHVDTGRVRYW